MVAIHAFWAFMLLILFYIFELMMGKFFWKDINKIRRS